MRKLGAKVNIKSRVVKNQEVTFNPFSAKRKDGHPKKKASQLCHAFVARWLRVFFHKCCTPASNLALRATAMLSAGVQLGIEKKKIGKLKCKGS